MVGEDGPRKRIRPAKSCEQCRHRKVRCDRNIPCGPCTRARASLDGSYRDRSLSPGRTGTGGPAVQQPVTEVPIPPTTLGVTDFQSELRSSLQEAQHRLESLEGRLDRLETNSTSTRDAHRLDQGLYDLAERTRDIEQQLAALTQPAPTDDQANVAVPEVPLSLHSTANKTKLLGPVHWMHRVDKWPRPSMAVQCYLRTFEPVYRVTHVPLFWREYDQFWSEPRPSPTCFLINLVLILAIGSVFHPDAASGIRDQFAPLRQKWVYAAQWWFTGPTEKTISNLDGVQVLCLLLISRRMGDLGCSPLLSTNSLVGMALQLGLHSDPGNFPTLFPFESEMRARLWATVLELALQASLEAGLSLFLPLDFDTRPPLNIDDRDISPSMSAPPVPKPIDQWADTSIQVMLRESVKLRVAVVQFVTGRGRKSYQRALHLGSEMRLLCRKFALFLQSVKPAQSAEGLRTTDFHRRFLDMELRRYILALHTPFTVQARHDPQFYYSRTASLECAMAIASSADNLNLPSSPMDDFSRAILVGRGALKGPLGLDIISVLGLEIVTQMEEESSPQSVSDPGDEMSKYQRAPIIQRLEHILDQLLQIITLGSPNLKRYNFLAAILGQIRAMESNRCLKRVVYETVKQCLEECYALLQANLARGPVPEVSPGILGSPHLQPAVGVYPRFVTRVESNPQLGLLI